jgi:hypothetical protein
MDRLGPTSDELTRADARPYFLWWTDLTVSELKKRLRSSDPDERAYFMGALLREANTRDIWLFVQSSDIERDWPRILRHLGSTREMWGYLLGLDATWPPRDLDTRA